jgi:hypothetical protein
MTGRQSGRCADQLVPCGRFELDLDPRGNVDLQFDVPACGTPPAHGQWTLHRGVDALRKIEIAELRRDPRAAEARRHRCHTQHVRGKLVHGRR